MRKSPAGAAMSRSTSRTWPDCAVKVNVCHARYRGLSGIWSRMCLRASSSQGKSDRGPHHRFDKLSLRSRRLTQGRQDMTDRRSYAVLAAEKCREIGDVARCRAVYREGQRYVLTDEAGPCAVRSALRTTLATSTQFAFGSLWRDLRHSMYLTTGASCQVDDLVGEAAEESQTAHLR